MKSPKGKNGRLTRDGTQRRTSHGRDVAKISATVPCQKIGRSKKTQISLLLVSEKTAGYTFRTVGKKKEKMTERDVCRVTTERERERKREVKDPIKVERKDSNEGTKA